MGNITSTSVAPTGTTYTYTYTVAPNQRIIGSAQRDFFLQNYPSREIAIQQLLEENHVRIEPTQSNTHATTASEQAHPPTEANPTQHNKPSTSQWLTENQTEPLDLSKSADIQTPQTQDWQQQIIKQEAEPIAQTEPTSNDPQSPLQQNQTANEPSTSSAHNEHKTTEPKEMELTLRKLKQKTKRSIHLQRLRSQEQKQHLSKKKNVDTIKPAARPQRAAKIRSHRLSVCRICS